jgi:serine protease Do
MKCLSRRVALSLKRRDHRVTSSLRMSTYCVCLLLAGEAFAQAQLSNMTGSYGTQLDRQKAAQSGVQTDLLKQLNASLETLVAKVSPAVVEVLVTGFGPVDDSEGTRTALVGRQIKLGSGVIVDPEGYIITNAHVVSNAQSIEVIATVQSKDTEERGAEKASYIARLVGLHKDTDLALLKIAATGLPYLPLDPKHPIHQGQLVLALGNPEGLGNSVTMGVVSAVDRQPDPKLPMVFIQTDAPINPGNSGGPLIDVDGYLLGINTFIVSASGGSEGLGFAIPSRVVSFVFDRLRKFGHVDRSEIGAASETITPLLAKGLQLPVTDGVVIVDVRPGGPAESAGLKINDIVLAVDGKQIRSLPQLAGSLYLHATDELMTLEVLRGADRITLRVPVLSQKHDVDRLLDLVDPQKNLVRKIGVLAIDVDDHTLALFPELRIRSGVIVVANTTYGRAVDVGLRPGDVIHAINTKPILSLAELQREIGSFDAGAAVVLQIERSEGMDYVAFEME